MKDRTLKETETLKLKKSTSELKEAVISIVAILNKHQKGEVYFGIKNDGSVVGQDIGEQTIWDVSKAVSDNIEPGIYPEISRVILDLLPIQYLRKKIYMELSFKVFIIELHKMSNERIALTERKSARANG